MTQTAALAHNTKTLPPVYLNTEQIAERYDVNEDTARRWIRQGRIPGVRIGGAYRVRLDDLQRLEREGEDFTIETLIEKPEVDNLLQALEDFALERLDGEDLEFVGNTVSELRRVLGTVSEERQLLNRIEEILHEARRPKVLPIPIEALEREVEATEPDDSPF